MRGPLAVVQPRRPALPTADEVLLVIERVLRDEVGVELVISPATKFHEELELDSLGTFSLIVAIEDQFQITLPETFEEEVRTLADLAALIVRQAQREEAA